MAAPAAWGGAANKMAWSEQVDEEEEKNGPLDQAFPTLGEAVKATQQKPGGKKKAKGTTLSLNDFMAAPAPGKFAPSATTGRATNRLIEEKSILLNLPTGSRGKVEGEEQPSDRLGGAFGNYGGDRGRGGFGSRQRSEDGDDRPPREASRADEADDWGATRKFVPSGAPSGSRGFGSSGFGGGGGGFGDRDRERDDRPPRREFAPSAADEASDWGSTRKFQPSGGGGGGERGGSFTGGYREREPLGGFRDGPGGGFREDRPPRREGGGFTEGPSRADEEQTWGRSRAFVPASDGPRAAGGPSGRDRSGERNPRGYGFSGDATAADTEERWGRGTAAAAASEASAAPPPAAAAAPAERPRLKLAPRSKPVETPETTEAAAEAGAPSPAAGQQVNGDAAAAAAAPAERPKKSNPFGAARPREEVLKEKGVDWKKEELKLEHGEVIRDKAPEEEELENEVEELRKKLEALKELTPGETDTLETMAAELDEKEKALYKLQAELDDKVRFSKGKPEPRPAEHDAAAAAAAGADRDFEPARPARGGGGGAAFDRGAGERYERTGSDRDARGGPRGEGGPRGDGPRGEGPRGRDRREGGQPMAPRDGSRDRRAGGVDRRGPPAPQPRPGAERERAW